MYPSKEWVAYGYQHFALTPSQRQAMMAVPMCGEHLSPCIFKISWCNSKIQGGASPTLTWNWLESLHTQMSWHANTRFTTTKYGWAATTLQQWHGPTVVWLQQQKPQPSSWGCKASWHSTIASTAALSLSWEWQILSQISVPNHFI